MLSYRTSILAFPYLHYLYLTLPHLSYPYLISLSYLTLSLSLSILSYLTLPVLTSTFMPLQTQTGKTYRSININHYATKKSAAQSMLDVALLMANSSQLKTVIYVGPQYRFYIPLLVLLSVSITLQVIVGLLLVFIVKYDLNDVRKHAKLNWMNNVATVFVFFTVLINIFITALGFEGQHLRYSSTEQIQY
uniref:Ninjurin-1-like n=1 Tax=Acanthochromis polyacanthus TaxID=80966 RepID=A0A3Q1FB14_9TELE